MENYNHLELLMESLIDLSDYMYSCNNNKLLVYTNNSIIDNDCKNWIIKNNVILNIAKPKYDSNCIVFKINNILSDNIYFITFIKTIKDDIDKATIKLEFANVLNDDNVEYINLCYIQHEYNINNSIPIKKIFQKQNVYPQEINDLMQNIIPCIQKQVELMCNSNDITEKQVIEYATNN